MRKPSITADQVPRRMRSVVREALAMGFTFFIAGGGHLRFWHQSTGETVFASGTPSCPYAAVNARRDLLRAAGMRP